MRNSPKAFSFFVFSAPFRAFLWLLSYPLSRRIRLYQPHHHRATAQAHRVADPKHAIQLGPVVLHRLGTDAQVSRNLLRSLSRPDAFDHLLTPTPTLRSLQ